MKTISINNNEYVLEYSFKAVEHKEIVQKMFNVMSGAYLVKDADPEAADANKGKALAAMINGVSEMVADVPHIVKCAFYAGLLENHEMSEDEAYQLMKQYMKENKYSFNKLFEDIKACMEDDGFFDLSGLNDMMEKMNQNMTAAQAKKPAKRTTKKSTSAN